MLNFTFTLVGFQLNPGLATESAMKKRLNVLKRIFFILLYWSTKIAVISVAISGSSIFETLGTFASQFLEIMAHTHVLWYLSGIKKLIFKLSYDLDEWTRRLLIFLSSSWFVVNVSFFISAGMIHQMSKTPTVWAMIPFIVNAFANPFLTSMPLQCFSLILLYAHQKRGLRILHSASKRGDSESMFDVASRMKKRCSEFEQFFSVHPLMWLMLNFLLTTYFLTLSPAASLRDHASFAALYYQLTINTFALVLIVWVREHVSSHKSSLVFTYLINCENGHREISASLSSALDEALACKFTVWGLLPINRELVFSFISTVLTFSVLTIQIINGKL